MEPLLRATTGRIINAEATAERHSFLALGDKMHQTKKKQWIKVGRADLRLLLKLNFIWKLSKRVLINTPYDFSGEMQSELFLNRVHVERDYYFSKYFNCANGRHERPQYGGPVGIWKEALPSFITWNVFLSKHMISCHSSTNMIQLILTTPMSQEPKDHAYINRQGCAEGQHSRF